jgi:hypothetical protein
MLLRSSHWCSESRTLMGLYIFISHGTATHTDKQTHIKTLNA